MTSESGVSYMMVQISVSVAFNLESNVCVIQITDHQNMFESKQYSTFIFVKCYDTTNKIGIEPGHDQTRAGVVIVTFPNTCGFLPFCWFLVVSYS